MTIQIDPVKRPQGCEIEKFLQTDSLGFLLLVQGRHAKGLVRFAHLECLRTQYSAIAREIHALDSHFISPQSLKKRLIVEGHFQEQPHVFD
jgi:hypothetical protein